MVRAHNSVTRTQSDAMAEVVSAKSHRMVGERAPPDYVEKVSRYLESSVGQGTQDEVSHEQAAADSDSGESLFITQQPVPEAERSARRLHKPRSAPKSPRELEGSGSDTSSSSSSSQRRSKSRKAPKKKKYRLPRYSFPFVSEWKSKARGTLVPVKQNISLHNYAMGGFFNCVKELWRYQCGEVLQSSLPTIDMENEYIHPLSDNEDERSGDDDIKIVERKRFVAPSKAKSQQNWCNQSKQQSSRTAADTRQETSGGRQQKTVPNDPAEASVSRATPAAKQQGNDEHLTSDKQFLFQTESPNTKGFTRVSNRVHIQQEAIEDELHTDSDATICESLEPQRSPRQYTQESRQASATAAEPETDVLHTADLTQAGQSEDEPDSQSLLHSLPDSENVPNHDGECAKTRVKRKRKKEKDKLLNEIVEEERSQSQQEPQGLHAASSVTTEVEGTPSLSQDNEEEPPASQTNDELGSNEINCMENSSHGDPTVRQEERDIHNSKQKKKKRKKEKSTAENVRQEVDGNVELDERMEDSGFSVGCNLENGGIEKDRKKKKKKKKKKMSEDAEQLQSSAVTEPLIYVAEPKKKKKERVITEECEEQDTSTKTLDLPPVSAGPLEESVCLENTAPSLESGYVKRKRHKKKQKSSSVGTSHYGGEGVDGSFSNDAAALEGSTEVELKKKKKKKKKTPSEEVDISHTPEENAKVEDVDNNQVANEGLEDQHAELVTKKKKKKKQKTPSEEMNISNTPEENEQVEKDIDIQQKTNKGLEDQNTELVTKKKKKKKKTTSEDVDISYTPEENGKVEDVDNNQVTNEGLEDQNAELVTKKKKKKQKTPSEEMDISNTPEKNKKVDDIDNHQKTNKGLEEQNAEPMIKKKKKKKKTTSEEMGISYTPEENKKVEDIDNRQKTNKGLEDLNAELVTKKKKKKKNHEPSSGNISEDNVAQSDNSASVRKKEKKRTSSFLVADAEETDAQTHEAQNSSSQSADVHVWSAEQPAVTASDFRTGSAEIAGNTEECDDRFRKKKKKRKRKMSGEPDDVEEDDKQAFKEPNKTCQSVLPDTTNTEVKRKKRRRGNESELVTLTEKLESAADAGHPPTDEVVVLKKKKKKKKKCKDDPCHEMQETPPAATEVIELEKLSVHTSGAVSPKKKVKHFTFPLAAKGKHGGSTEISHDNYTSDNASNETLHVPEQAAPKKKKKIKSTDNVAKSLIKCAELERNKRSAAPNITSSRPTLSETSSSEMSSLDCVMKKKHSKVKRALHNPSMDFLTD